MSKKNSNVILRNGFKESEDLSKLYFSFKQKLKNFKKKSLVVAISGGPDSLALAALSKAYSYENQVKFHYVLVDHNIRKNSKKEAIAVKKLLLKHKIHLNILMNKSKINKNIQSQARKIRYDLLVKFCKKKKIKIILTAHNLEDQVETFFIRLSRGSGLTGLAAMKSSSKLSNNIILSRPLLDTKKRILIKISKNVFGKYFKDPSNNNKKYLRTKIRNLKRPLLKSGISYDQIIKSINNLASSKETLDDYYNKIFNKIVKRSKKLILIDFIKFKNLNVDIKIKILNDSIKSLKNNYYFVRSKKVINLIKNIESHGFKKGTLGGCLFFIKKDKLCLKIEQSD